MIPTLPLSCEALAADLVDFLRGWICGRDKAPRGWVVCHRPLYHVPPSLDWEARSLARLNARLAPLRLYVAGTRDSACPQCFPVVGKPATGPPPVADTGGTLAPSISLMQLM